MKRKIVSEYTQEMANILHDMIETPLQTRIYGKFMNINNEYKEAWLLGVLDMYSLCGCSEDLSATQDLYNFILQFGIDRTMREIDEVRSQQLEDILHEQSVESATKAIQSFMCPKCHNKTVYDADRDVYGLLDIKYGDLFICDECASEFEGRVAFDNTVELTPLQEEE